VGVVYVGEIVIIRGMGGAMVAAAVEEAVVMEEWAVKGVMVVMGVTAVPAE